MRLFRKSVGLGHDIAMFAVLAQFWLTLACCIGPVGQNHIAFGPDSWCSSAPKADTSSDNTSDQGHAHDCVAACAAVAQGPATGAFSWDQAAHPIAFTGVESQAALPTGFFSGALGSRAPPISL